MLDLDISFYVIWGAVAVLGFGFSVAWDYFARRNGHRHRPRHASRS